MKTYTEITFTIHPFSEDIADALIAALGDIDYSGFNYTETGFQTYIPSDKFREEAIQKLEILPFLTEHYDIHWKCQEIEDRDWNKEWEDHFTPILINNRILVRAGFHQPMPDIEYEIIIEPKMSFGTGHHSTTALMLQTLLNYSSKIKGKKVLDMGCGTGILSIMTSKLKAHEITGIDIDEWAYQNAMENIRANRLDNIRICIGDARLLETMGDFDFILANINRNILLHDMHHYTAHLAQNGFLIMSGFYTQDLPSIQQKATELGLSYQQHQVENNWVAASFYKG